MIELLYPGVVSDVFAFVEFFEENDCAAAREAVITSDAHRYAYCKYIGDSEEIWPEISDNLWLARYGLYVKNREEIWAKIDDEWLVEQCSHGDDRIEFWSAIDSDEWRAKYCAHVRYRQEVWNKISSAEWKAWYHRDIGGN